MEYKLPSRDDYKKVSEEYYNDFRRLLEARQEQSKIQLLEEPVVPGVVWNFDEGILERLFTKEDWNDDVYYINENWSYGKSKRYVKTIKDYTSKQTVVLFSPSDFRRLTSSSANQLVVDVERMLVFRTHIRLHGELYEPKSMESFTYDWLIKKNRI